MCVVNSSRVTRDHTQWERLASLFTSNLFAPRHHNLNLPYLFFSLLLPLSLSLDNKSGFYHSLSCELSQLWYQRYFLVPHRSFNSLNH